jgi:hypothetical protein
LNGLMMDAVLSHDIAGIFRCMADALEVCLAHQGEPIGFDG